MNLTKMKIAALRKLAIKKEIEGAEELETRTQLIDALRAKLAEEESEAPKEEAPEKPEEAEAGIEAGEVTPSRLEAPPIAGPGVEERHVAVGSKAARMKARLAKQPKVRILIARDPKEPKGSTFPVTLNGYRLNIRKGVYVEVPQQVADVVMDSQLQTEAADEEFKRTETGAPMRIDAASSDAALE